MEVFAFLGLHCFEILDEFFEVRFPGDYDFMNLLAYNRVIIA